MFGFAFKAYRRRFAGVFSNAREHFETREGLLLRVEDRDGRVGFGEAAPLPSFGSESFPVALSAAVAIGDRFDWDSLRPNLMGCPSLLFGLESALELLTQEEGAWAGPGEPWAMCRLVDAWGDSSPVVQALDFGYRSLKFKIGREAFAMERRALEAAAEQCEGRAALRLDANGTLGLRETRQWLEFLSELPVEFLEQPMAPGCESDMRRLAGDFSTPLALDESVCQVDDLKRWRDAQWPGVFVLKASLAGSRQALRQELSQGACDCVYSSALETVVGAVGALSLAAQLPGLRRPLGFGVGDFFADAKVSLDVGAFLPKGTLPGTAAMQELWNRI